MSPTGFEPVTPSLKVRCSKTNWATKTLSKWQGSNLRPESPKLPALPNWATPRYYGGESGIRTRGSVKISDFQDRCNKPTLPSLLIVVSAGLEPTHPEPKSGALPLGYETINKANISKNLCWAPYQNRTDFSWLQVRCIAINAYRANIKQKTRDF